MIRLIISDVAVTIVLGQPAVAGDAVVVWLDDEGRMQFRAPPHLRRFLQSLNYDQLRALLPDKDPP